jgi:energy-coupling factor transporter ATP-binding protein EcfA2
MSAPQGAPSQPAIEVRNVSKVYRLWSTSAWRLWVPLLQRLHRLTRGWLEPLAGYLQSVIDRHLRLHEALHGVDFSLHRGDALGIIGLNGSGKSTLLQIIAGVLQPTGGSVVVRGRVAALLERGRMVLEASPEEVVTEYLYRIHADALKASRDHASLGLERVDFGYGAEDACVVAASINDCDRHASLRYGEKVELALDVRLTAQVVAPQLIVDVMDGKGLQLTGRRIPLSAPQADGLVRLQVGFDATLQKGVYRLRMRVVDAPTLEQTVVLSRQEGWLSFDIVDDSRDLFTGLFPIPMSVGQR